MEGKAGGKWERKAKLNLQSSVRPRGVEPVQAADFVTDNDDFAKPCLVRIYR
jgi:hypothetical protein